MMPSWCSTIHTTWASSAGPGGACRKCLAWKGRWTSWQGAWGGDGRFRRRSAIRDRHTDTGLSSASLLEFADPGGCRQRPGCLPGSPRKPKNDIRAWREDSILPRRIAGTRHPAPRWIVGNRRCHRGSDGGYHPAVRRSLQRRRPRRWLRVPGRPGRDGTDPLPNLEQPQPFRSGRMPCPHH